MLQDPYSAALHTGYVYCRYRTITPNMKKNKNNSYANTEETSRFWQFVESKVQQLTTDQNKHDTSYDENIIRQSMHRGTKRFFDHNRISLPELATFYDVTKKKGVKGIWLEEQYWRTVEHYFQYKKICYIEKLTTDETAFLQKMFRTVQDPQIIFDFVHNAIPEESTEEAFAGLNSFLREHQGAVLNQKLKRRWHRDKITFMQEALMAKYDIPEMREILLGASDQEILSGAPVKPLFLVEVNPNDWFWGIGTNKHQPLGLNGLGLMTTNIRNYWLKKLRAERKRSLDKRQQQVPV